MKKLICLFSISILFLSACSSENDEITNPSATLLPGKLIISSDVQSPVIYDYHFNGNKIENRTTNGFLEKYTYTGDLITKIEGFENNVVNLIQEYFYTDGKLTTYTRKLKGRDYYDKYQYTYHSDGTVSFVVSKVTISTGDEEITPGVNIFTFKNGNIVKYERGKQIGKTTSTTYEYDNKNNPNKNIIGYNKLIAEEPQASSSVNNVISYTYKSAEITYTNQIKYVYDVNDFPTAINYGQSVDFTFTYSYK
jgi:hypothetical protein